MLSNKIYKYSDVERIVNDDGFIKTILDEERWKDSKQNQLKYIYLLINIITIYTHNIFKFILY